MTRFKRLAGLRRRVVGGSARELGELRAPLSSFPFLSGDTFRFLAGTEFHELGLVRRTGLPQHRLFCSIDSLLSSDFLPQAESWVSANGTGSETLIVHNGDARIDRELLNRLGRLFRKVFCVNVLRESANVRALPIGLENAALNNNGRLNYYLDGLEAPRNSHRPQLVLASFHEETNPAVRAPARRLFEKSRFGFAGHRWKRKEYREVVRETCFVVSPPGNGPDCHRTWEAIYLGAVPVVLRGSLAPSLWRDMPIHTVEKYEDFLSLTDAEMRDLYARLIQRPPAKAFADYWISELES